MTEKVDIVSSAEPAGSLGGERAVDVQALRESEHHMRSIFEQTDDAISVRDLTGRFIAVNRRGADIAGLPAEAIIGLSPRDVFAGDAAMIEATDRQVLESGEPVTYEQILPTPRGPRRFQTRKSLHRGPDGAVVGFVAVTRDITAQAATDAALRRAEDRQAAVLSALPDLMFLVDRRGVFLDYHAPAGTHLAAPPEFFLGKPIGEVLPGDVARQAMAHIERAHETAEAQVFEYALDGVFGTHFEARVVASGEDEVLVVIRDVTARHRAEAALREQNEKLRELDRLKGDFISAVSHELRTPLTSIVGYTEFLEDDPLATLTDEQIEFVEQIQASTKRLRRLVDDLLEFGLLDTDTFGLACAELDLAHKLPALLHSLRPQLDRKRIVIELVMPEGPLPVVADRDRLEQVLTNLIGNAIKFTPEDGRIVVTAASDAETVELAVTDTGIGIPEDKLPRLFEKFFQVDRSLRRVYGGAGLGLAISKALVEAHGGTISVESVAGAGSTFRVRLPRVGDCAGCGEGGAGC
ncbi:MAG: ATP-binding protein [Candidatus Sericytochromatia bacterium]